MFLSHSCYDIVNSLRWVSTMQLRRYFTTIIYYNHSLQVTTEEREGAKLKKTKQWWKCSMSRLFYQQVWYKARRPLKYTVYHWHMIHLRRHIHLAIYDPLQHVQPILLKTDIITVILEHTLSPIVFHKSFRLKIYLNFEEKSELILLCQWLLNVHSIVYNKPLYYIIGLHIISH